MKYFSDLGLLPELCKALKDESYERPTPIQEQAIPPLLAGRDVLGCAQTGTGKTAAFALPVLQHLQQQRKPGKRALRVLVLTPTRELAAQIGESFAVYGKYLSFRHRVIFGGVGERPQIEALRRGLDILVATPGRLLDLQGRGFVDLSAVDFFILDEADRMLDMGFVHDVKRVLKVLPTPRSNLLFSATMPPSIVKLAGSFLVEPVSVSVAPQATTADGVEQVVMFVERGDKKRLLAQQLRQKEVGRAIVFTRTKRGANRLAQLLERDGISSAAIHGNKSQGARTRALESFRKGDVPVLVATDLAARGIDVQDITHVFNYELPNIPESYVHRAGRTARAGRKGVAISFCDSEEGEYLRDIEKLIGEELSVDDEHDWHSLEAEREAESPSPRKKPKPAAAGQPRRTGRPGQRSGGAGARRASERRGGSRGEASRKREGGGGSRRSSGSRAGTPKSPRGRGPKKPQ